jgi:hypothetical protein
MVVAEASFATCPPLATPLWIAKRRREIWTAWDLLGCRHVFATSVTGPGAS